MIATVIRTAWLRFRRSPVDLVMTLVLPIIFFTIFALIMGGMGRSTTPKLNVVIVDEDQTSASKRLADSLRQDESLRERPKAKPDEPFNRELANRMVKEGKTDVAIIIPKGFGDEFGAIGQQSQHDIELLYDSSNKIAPQMIGGLLQKSAFGLVDVLAKRGFEQLDRFAALTPLQKMLSTKWVEQLAPKPAAEQQGKAEAVVGKNNPPAPNEPAKQGKNKPTDAAAADKPSASFSLDGIVPYKLVDVVAAPSKESPVSFEAAAIAVMFLLFSAVAAGGTILEEQESGTLERLLGSQLSLTQLLAGKWIWCTLIGTVQIVVMFLWAWLVFKVDLWNHILPFLVLTLVTAGAASSLGLILACVARSRAQLQGLSTIVILSMSALGGSMIPRFLFSDTLKQISLVTFNAWAIDGYVDIFWRDKGVLEIWAPLLVLGSASVLMFGVARLLAKRWEAA